MELINQENIQLGEKRCKKKLVLRKLQVPAPLEVSAFLRSLAKETKEFRDFRQAIHRLTDSLLKLNYGMQGV